MIKSFLHRGLRRYYETGFKLHALKGKDKGQWSIRVNGNWRITFEFREGHACIRDYEDYH